jgi:HPt (histidine-containing phosphotransfer) domain-containing protein
VVDVDNALSHLGGDRKLLGTLIGVYLKESERWLADLKAAVAERRPADVKRLAHNFKGSLGHFGARSAFAAAQKVENVGRSGILDGVEEACRNLEDELERLRPALAAFVRQG